MPRVETVVVLPLDLAGKILVGFLPSRTGRLSGLDKPEVGSSCDVFLSDSLAGRLGC